MLFRRFKKKSKNKNLDSKSELRFFNCVVATLQISNYFLSDLRLIADLGL
jgi:hypothetical protein